MDGKLTEELLKSWRNLERLDFAALPEAEMTQLVQLLRGIRLAADNMLQQITWLQADRWWSQLPEDELVQIRLLLKGAALSPHLFVQTPEHSHLMMLLDVEDPDTARLWVMMSAEQRKQRMEELQQVLASDQSRQTGPGRYQQEQDALRLAYDMLGITPNAPWPEVRRAYRRLASVYHPDKGGDPHVFRSLQKAYELLKRAYV